MMARAADRRWFRIRHRTSPRIAGAAGQPAAFGTAPGRSPTPSRLMMARIPAASARAASKISSCNAKGVARIASLHQHLLGRAHRRRILPFRSLRFCSTGHGRNLNIFEGVSRAAQSQRPPVVPSGRGHRGRHLVVPSSIGPTLVAERLSPATGRRAPDGRAVGGIGMATPPPPTKGSRRMSPTVDNREEYTSAR